MLKKLNHIAIVVPSVGKAKEIYEEKFNAKVSEPKTYKEHGVQGLVNLFGIESPGLTSSLALAKKVGKILN